MKKLLLLLTLLTLVLVLVACGEDKPPVDVTTDPPANTTGAAQVTYTVKFVDADMFGNEVLDEKEVRRGKSARPPRDPEHEGYVFIGWDIEDYSSVVSDMVITAQYRKADKYLVHFYANDVLLASVEVNEGEAVAEPEVEVEIGYSFNGWDKPTKKVNRSWSDFEAYANLTDEERANTVMEYRTNALFFASGLVVPKKSNISFKLTEKVVDGKTVYVPDEVFSSNSFKYEEVPTGYFCAGVPASERYNKVTLSSSYAWDGEYIYVYVEGYDPTLMTRGEAFCLGNENPWQNDAIEIWHCYNKPGNSKQVALDCYGYRMTGTVANLEEYEAIAEVNEETKCFYMIFKIPAKDFEGNKMKPGSICYMAIQIDDLRDAEVFANLPISAISEEANMYATIGNPASYTLGFLELALGE